MKSKIMKNAWQLAREGQAKFGGSVREFLSEAMKIAWKESREMKKIVASEETKNFFEKNYKPFFVFSDSLESEIKILKEVKKAMYLEIENFKFWCPKNDIYFDENDQTAGISSWVVKSKNLKPSSFQEYNN